MSKSRNVVAGPAVLAPAFVPPSAPAPVAAAPAFVPPAIAARALAPAASPRLPARYAAAAAAYRDARRAGPVYTAQSVIVAPAVNPKKPGTACHARFALMEGRPTVAEFGARLRRIGQERYLAAEMAYNLKHGFVTLEDSK